jgi:hypothetical protein
MIPLYGFLEGDSIGLVILARAENTMRELSEKLQQAARTRVAPLRDGVVYFAGQERPAAATVAEVGIRALDRFDVRERA